VSLSNSVVEAGSASALLGNPSYNTNCSNGGIPTDIAYVAQTITLPSSPHQTLTLSYRIFTQDWTGPDIKSPAYDSFGVYVNGLGPTNAVFYDGNPTATAATKCDGPILDLGWRTATVDLSQFAGQTITLYFVDENGGSTFWNTYTYLDGVAIATE
jgi:hypothetical protein